MLWSSFSLMDVVTRAGVEPWPPRQMFTVIPLCNCDSLNMRTLVLGISPWRSMILTFVNQTHSCTELQTILNWTLNFLKNKSGLERLIYKTNTKKFH